MNAPKNRSVRTAALVGVALCAGFVIGRDSEGALSGSENRAAVEHSGVDGSRDESIGLRPDPIETGPIGQASGLRPSGPGLSSVRDVVARTRSAVVSLDVVRSSSQEIDQTSTLPPDEDRVQDVSTGSGFVFDSSGLVLTAGHLVEDAVVIIVDQPGEPTRFASVVGRDSFSDLAVLQIEDVKGPVPSLPLDSVDAEDPLLAGDWVVTIGGPLGLDQSVGAGLVSHPGRLLRSERGDAVEFYLQLAGPVHPGSSGGPVMDLRGDLVGVTIRKLHDAPGISFALPVSTVRRVVSRLIDGSLRRSHLGASLSRARWRQPEGAVPDGGVAITITSVKPGKAADRAGLQLGDVVVSIDDEPIASLRSFHEQVTWAEPDSEVSLKVWREGQLMGAFDVEVDLLSDDVGPALMP